MELLAKGEYKHTKIGFSCAVWWHNKDKNEELHVANLKTLMKGYVM